MDLINKIESLRYDIENGNETDVISISVRLIQIKEQALLLLQPQPQPVAIISVCEKELFEKLKFVLECKNESMAERIIEQFIFRQNELKDEFAIDFAKWIIAKNKEEHKNKTLSQITFCSNEQLLEIFKLENTETVA